MKQVFLFFFCMMVLNPYSYSSGVDQRGLNCIVVDEPGFPAIETSALSYYDLQKMYKNDTGIYVIRKADFAVLHKQLSAGSKIDLLIWPYGSAMTDRVWPDIYNFLLKGGNIMVTGGRPFSADIVESGGSYRVHGFTNRFTEQLNIFDTYTVASAGMKNIVRNPEFDFLPTANGLHPTQSFSLLTLTGTTKLPENLWGNLSSRFSTILSATDSTGENSIPLVSCFDHYHSDFVGGRWIFLTFIPQPGYWQSEEGRSFLKSYIEFAAQKNVEIDPEPGYAFYHPGEIPDLTLHLKSKIASSASFLADVTIRMDNKNKENFTNISVSVTDTLVFLKMKKPAQEGLYTIVLTLKQNDRIIEKRINGFICGDIKQLNSGVPFSATSSFLTRGGKPYPVVGMTYMSAEKHRHFLKYPNPVIWDREMKEMKNSGINMLRTGLWKWYPDELFVDKQGHPDEKILRSLDAWLYTAKKYDLPVQYCLFPFQPQVHGSDAPYTDEKAFEVQSRYLSLLAGRYKDNPDLIWDLINEPTYGKDGQLWTGNFPTGTVSEKALWNQWLIQMYGDRLHSLPAMVNTLASDLLDSTGVKLPEFSQFEKANLYAQGHKPLIAYDYNFFAQFAYNSWVTKVRQIFTNAGSHQLIATGMDEGSVTNRILSPFLAETGDFTVQHSWWQDEDLLWDNLMAKAPGKPLLIQETNLMRFTDLRERNRRNEQDYVKTLERKLCVGLGAEGAGVIPWIWDANTMLNENESSIGINRCDGTASPEKRMYRDFAEFVHRNAAYFTDYGVSDVIMVAPLSLHLSSYQQLSVNATKNAVRAMHYYARNKFTTVSEYHLDKVTVLPKLIILPSPQVLSDKAWETLQNWVTLGATLLITGPVDRDPHFEPVSRLAGLGVETNITPVLESHSVLVIDKKYFPLDYYNTSAMKYIDKMVWKEDHGQVKEIQLGKGKILITEFPVELNTDLNTTAALYKYASGIAHVIPCFSTTCTNPGILIRPVDFKEARMYLFESETENAENVTITDTLMNKEYKVNLEPGRAKLLLISKSDGTIIDQY